MQVTSLFDLRQQLAVYLLPLLGECEILYSMPVSYTHLTLPTICSV